MTQQHGGISGHESASIQKYEWLTPPEIIKDLGPFDLDPCAPINRPWPTASKHYTISDDGLWQTWAESDFIWMNPPYGKHTGDWLQKLSEHGNGIALVFARTDTQMFFDFVWPAASCMLMIKSRLTFYNVDGTPGDFNGGAPSVLIGYGDEAFSRLNEARIKGCFIDLTWSAITGPDNRRTRQENEA